LIGVIEKIKGSVIMKKVIVTILMVAASILLINGCVAKGPETTTSFGTTKPTKMAQVEPQSHTVGIAAGGFHEACEDEWKVGYTVKCSFTSTKPVVFNVHYHDSKDVKHYNISDILVDDFSDSFTVQNENVHCAMWQNNSDSFVKLTYQIEVVK
jgi:PBP1b-binding outer membrane lipoprotein LpoB